MFALQLELITDGAYTVGVSYVLKHKIMIAFLENKRGTFSGHYLISHWCIIQTIKPN